MLRDGLVVTRSVESAKLDAGSGSGLAARYLNLDRSGDMLLPGCFAGCIENFLKTGTVNLSHFEPLPIGFPTAAHETDEGLRVAWKYHTTEDAQAAYTVAKEAGSRYVKSDRETTTCPG